ncbi:hypothetical protein, partial [Brunnivagina elsteri]|uniref:hypothetical protein n=1 Tax=Brunnivagina elsteri TaxID=1247191 RepID=UPI001B807EDE
MVTKFMLGSFQNLYPTSCLLTELVQIYNGKYIVKASLQIEGITRATGMAAAEVLEEAEDRSRERALAIFVTDNSAIPQVDAIAIPSVSTTSINPSINDAIPSSYGTNSPTVSYPQGRQEVASVSTLKANANATSTTIPTPAKTAKKTQITPEIPANNPTGNSPTTKIKANIVETEEKLEEKSNIISTENSQEVHAPEPELKPELESPLKLEEAIPNSEGVSSVSAIASTPQQSTSSNKTKPDVTSKESNQDLAANLNQNLSEDLSKETSEITTPVNQIEPLPEFSHEQLFDISLESSAPSDKQTLTPREYPATEAELPFPESNTATSNVMPFTPGDYNPPEEIEILLPPVPESTPTTTTSKRKKKSEPEDNSDDIAKIGVEMQRLYWTVEQGKDYLFQTYGKKSRHSL